ncbi:glycosyl hydrolase family 95 catalytic domain-containing protein [Streptomyces endophyticus]|uniref:Tat pathway signal sequence domain protein n=1 Tax=Streptomyces endophyticus TaxID=714166 RepID=A0ABU6F7U1_9ACTN|nr:Tat pathway signal sequence domain protein [Streptomyces endophyticus]MEB8339538.1 Tat pathway signal sequence domain protein [Streptomyces endophyticus]
MASRSVNRSPVPRRAVLGTALGGATAVALSGTAHAAEPSADDDTATSGGDRHAWKLRDTMTGDGAWEEFLRGQDLLWTKLPTRWYDGPFLGDGLLGSMIYQEPDANQVRFTVQHGRVQDHRPEFGSGWGTARLPVGHLTLEPVGTITAVDWRLSLWNAELTGTVTTTAGTLTLAGLIQDEVLALRATADGGEEVHWTFHPEEAISPRKIQEDPPAGYTANPAWTTRTRDDGTEQVLQPLTGGGRTATAYRRSGDELLLSVGHSFPSDTAAESDSLRNLRRASSYSRLKGRHADWWHAFYRKSFVSFPDQRLQSFHWIQLYKVASASRAGAPVMATPGPWLEPTPWPGVWWNLNVQLEYWLIHGSNHLELDSLATTVRQGQEQFIANVPAAYRSDSSGVGRSSDMFATREVGEPGTGAETGDLTWALHNVWLSYRHTMDESLLRDTVFPVLRRAINYYLHFLDPGSDGKLHLPSTLSPEYPVVPPQDTNYDLALIRWGCQTLIESAERLGIDDELMPRWQEVLAKLVPYPVNDDGFMIGADTPYAQSHRHYSHMLSVYPLYLVNWERAEDRDLITKSVEHWHAITGAHRGYSYTGAASIYASTGDGDTALTYLRKFFDPDTSYPCRANTHYTEAGPVIETPLSASQSLHDMFCQSWGSVVRVFPAVPSAWADLTLHNFLTQGAFLVSAVRKKGTTRFIRVRSLAGEPLKLRHGLSGSLTVLLDDGTPADTEDLGDGTLAIDLPKGREVLVHAGERPDLTVGPVAISEPGAAWGLP